MKHGLSGCKANKPTHFYCVILNLHFFQTNAPNLNEVFRKTINTTYFVTQQINKTDIISAIFSVKNILSRSGSIKEKYKS